jgi:hypothetical protein
VRAQQILNTFTVFCLFFTEGFCQVETPDWKSLNQTDYSLSFPASWSLDQSGQMGTKFILFTGQDNSGFRDNLNLIIQDLGVDGLNLDKYVSLSERQIKTMITNAEIIEWKRLKVGGNEFQEVIFKGDQGVLHLKWRQHYWVKGDKACILTFTSSQSTYDQYVQVCQKLFGSFSLK